MGTRPAEIGSFRLESFTDPHLVDIGRQRVCPVGAPACQLSGGNGDCTCGRDLNPYPEASGWRDCTDRDPRTRPG